MAAVWQYSSKLKAALLAEFIGMMIFQIYGGNAPDSVAAFGNGITLVVLVYATANVSGGCVPERPSVTASQHFVCLASANCQRTQTRKHASATVIDGHALERSSFVSVQTRLMVGMRQTRLCYAAAHGIRAAFTSQPSL